MLYFTAQHVEDEFLDGKTWVSSAPKAADCFNFARVEENVVAKDARRCLHGGVTLFTLICV